MVNNNPLNTSQNNLLNNRYRILRSLGEGGFGATFLAEDTQMPSQRQCVIKQLKPITDNPDVYQLVQERFQREAAVLETLGNGCAQIPSLYAYFNEDQKFYLIQEWIDGSTLEQWVQTHGTFSENAARNLWKQLLQILTFVHKQGIIHRDIKPDNIILRAPQQQPVLIDFGAVRETMGTLVNSNGNPTSSIVIGTPGYMSSEQAAGRPLPSSDLYSLGLTILYALTGKGPQTLPSDPRTGELQWRDQLTDQNPISPLFAGILDKVIQPHPRDRYPDANAILAVLEGVGSPVNTSINPPQPSIQTLPPDGTNHGTNHNVPNHPATHPAATPNLDPANNSNVATWAVAPKQPPALTPVATPSNAVNPAVINHQSTGNSSGDRKLLFSLLGGIALLTAILLGVLQWLRPSFLSSNREPATPTPTLPDSTNPNQPSTEPTSEPTVTPDSTSQNPEVPTETRTNPPSEPDIWQESDPDAPVGLLKGGDRINIYEKPGGAGEPLHYGVASDRVSLLSRAENEAGEVWYLVEFPKSAARGWVSAVRLDLVDPRSNTNSEQDDPPAPPPDQGNETLNPPDNENRGRDRKGDRPEDQQEERQEERQDRQDRRENRREDRQENDRDQDSPKKEDSTREGASEEGDSGSVSAPGFLQASGSRQIAVYENPSRQARSPHYGISGDAVYISEWVRTIEGQMWYRVRFQSSGAEGWVPEVALSF
jgi:serine/threonine protein kinase, bacterial